MTLQLIARHPGAAVHAQRLVPSRDEEDQPDVRVGQQVQHPVQALVAGTIGDDQPVRVEHLDRMVLIVRILVGFVVLLDAHPIIGIMAGGCQLDRVLFVLRP